MRKPLLATWLGLLFLGILVLFWRNEWKYSLPTPVPEQYTAVPAGEKINFNGRLSQRPGSPLFLHFFNPSCPCSRFNMPHFKSLVKQYGNQVDFAIVVLSSNEYSEQQIQNKFELDIPVYFDPAIAASCGVYSTPQAAIIQPDSSLFYRGNYNKSRYCTSPKTNYAQIALEGLLKNTTTPSFRAAALKAYGCTLPNCTR